MNAIVEPVPVPVTTQVPAAMLVLIVESAIETSEIASTDEMDTALLRVTVIWLVMVISVGSADVRVARGVSESWTVYVLVTVLMGPLKVRVKDVPVAADGSYILMVLLVQHETMLTG